MSPGAQGGSIHVDRYFGNSFVSNPSRTFVSQGVGDASDINKMFFKTQSYGMTQNLYNAGYNGHNRSAPLGQQNDWIGVPLISMANNNRRNRKPFLNHNPSASVYNTRVNPGESRCIELNNGQQIPLSKLALHTQGAPLIIQGRYNNRNKPGQNFNNSKNVQVNNNKVFKGAEFVNKKPDCNYVKIKGCALSTNGNQVHGRNSVNNVNIDTASVTSDESSGSANSEACLPRIIKPRKRRKKDRKPANNSTNQEQSVHKIESIDENGDLKNSHKSFHDGCYDSTRETRSQIVNRIQMEALNSPLNAKYNNSQQNMLSDLTLRLMINTGNKANMSDYIIQSVDCKASSVLQSISSVCQCRYCDPTGLVWNVDSSGVLELFDDTSTPDFAPTKLADSMKVVGSNSKRSTPNLILDKDMVLRRSWSDPSATNFAPNTKYDTNEPSINQSTPNLLYSLFSDSSQQSTDMSSSFIYGKNNKDAKNSCQEDSSNQLVPDIQLEKPSASVELNLEVSSEIVTSLNGHRDLEIKFFSTSPPAVSSNCNSNCNSFFSSQTVENKHERIPARSIGECSDSSKADLLEKDPSTTHATEDGNDVLEAKSGCAEVT